MLPRTVTSRSPEDIVLPLFSDHAHIPHHLENEPLENAARYAFHSCPSLGRSFLPRQACSRVCATGNINDILVRFSEQMLRFFNQKCLMVNDMDHPGTRLQLDSTYRQ